MSMLIFFTSRYYYFFEKLKTVEKNLCKLNCPYGKILHTLNRKQPQTYPGNKNPLTCI